MKRISEVVMKYRINKIIRVAILCISILIFCPAQTKARIIHFPSDKSMGTLYVQDSNLVDTIDYGNWEFLCEAKGEVAVPDGKVLRLNLNKKAGDDLSPLSRLSSNNLQMLYCRNVEMADDQLQYISNLTGLQELNLQGTRILGTGLKYITKLYSLKSLWLDDTHVDDDSLRHLRNLTSLKYLSLMNANISDEGLSYLANLRKMEYLDIRNTQVSNEGLIHLKQMTKLKWLNLWNTRVTQEGLVHIENLGNLERLGLDFDVDSGLKYLSGMTSLKAIRIDAGLMTPEELGLLSKMKSIEEIHINCSKRHWGDNTNLILKELAQSLKPKSLYICHGLTDKGLLNIATMQSLQELSILEAQITSEGLAALAELPLLRELSIVDMEFPSEREWQALGMLSSLEHLDLFAIQSEISDAYIAHLSQLNHLKYLAISSNQGYARSTITDNSMAYISGLKSLENLSLSDAKITAQGLQHVADLPALREITFENCEIPEQGVQQLKERLPDLRCNIH